MLGRSKKYRACQIMPTSYGCVCVRVMMMIVAWSVWRAAVDCELCVASARMAVRVVGICDNGDVLAQVDEERHPVLC
eukprot:m.434240 g.434240  ORF g.434240 m.434240 type:complete len:77 (-) comp96469_c0_seq1:274-504(-)